MRQKSFQKLLRYLKPFTPLIIGLILFSILTVIFQVLIPVQIGRAINFIVASHQVNITAVSQSIIILIVLALAMALSQYLQEQLSNRLTYRITEHLHQDTFQQIHQVPLQKIDQYNRGDLVNRVINDVDLIGTGLLQSFTSFFSGLALIIGVIVMMLLLNWKIALIVIILTPLSVIVSSVIANRMYSRFQEQIRLRSELNSYVEEMATSQEIVRAFTYEAASFEQFKKINQALHESGVWSQFYGALINPTSRVINSLVYAAVGIFGAFAVLNGALSVGILSSFLAYTQQYTKPFNEISAVINEMQTALAAAERVFSFLEWSKEATSRNHYQLSAPKGEVAFDQAYFSYQLNRPLIENFSLSVKAGDTVAVVGPTGAGKTTLINLLMRFYELDAGKISIDHIQTIDMARDDVRRLFGMVLQDSWIFEGTVLENIAYGKPDAQFEEIVQAAKQAKVHEMIMTLPEGYETILEENGANISTGQKQLICIARVMLMQPDMLILDEATSSIDTLTERMIQEAFDHMMAGRTTFIVAHRLSTIENADLILYMEQGTVKEQGTHTELLNKEGKYYHLYQSQFQQATD